MKKAKGSKGKKLFVKRESSAVGAETVREPAVVADETIEQALECRKTTDTSVEADGGAAAAKTGNPVVRPVEGKDAWEQAFVDENTILIKRTVRSGQRIQFDGSVVVMGDVNPGSEIIASGNIVIMGALRGVVHAGATGNEAATVSAFKLQPTQLRIANHITRAPDGDYPIPEHPETARIKDGVVVIEIFQLGQDRQTKIC